MEKELIWVDKNLIGKLDIVQDICRLKSDDLDKILEDLKKDDKYSLEGIDDTLIEIKHHAKRVRDEYKKCADEEIEKTTELWENLDEKVHENRTKIGAYEYDVKELLNSINNINRAIDSISFDKLERAMEFIEKFNSMTNKEKQCLTLLFENLK